MFDKLFDRYIIVFIRPSISCDLFIENWNQLETQLCTVYRNENKIKEKKGTMVTKTNPMHALHC